MKRLSQRLPTALQLEPDVAFLFHEHGVCRFTDPNHRDHYMPLESPKFDRIWALVDSNQNLMQPAGLFNTGAPFFVVESASSRPPRLRWLSKVKAITFHMKRWTFSEVLQAFVDLSHVCHNAHAFYSRSFLGDTAPYAEHQLWHLFDTYGASPRALATYARRPELYESAIARQVRAMDPEAFQAALSSPYSDDHSDLILVIEPSATSRAGSTKTVASQHILEMLWGKIHPPLIPGKFGYSAHCQMAY